MGAKIRPKIVIAKGEENKKIEVTPLVGKEIRDLAWPDLISSRG